MEYFENYYKDKGLWERMSKGLIDIEEYHKSEEYGLLSTKEQEEVDKEISTFNKNILDSIKFYPYPGDNYKEPQEILNSIETINEVAKLLSENSTVDKGIMNLTVYPKFNGKETRGL